MATDSANRRSGRSCPKTCRPSATREVDRSALEQREDIAKLSVSLRNDLTAKGLQFNDVDRPVFQEALGKTTYYKDWKAKFGDEAWRTSRVHRRAGVNAMKVEPVGAADITDAFAPAGRHWAVPVDTVLRYLVEIRQRSWSSPRSWFCLQA